MGITRKDFLRTTGTGIIGAFTLGTIPAKGIDRQAIRELNFGLASYSFREFSLEETVKMTKRMGLKYLSLKSMHMPLDSTKEQLESEASKVRSEGIDLYGAGVIYMNTKEQVDQAFTYAKNVGLNVIIGVPNHELLPLVDKKVQETDIKVAIHNHGPGDKLYSSPDDIWEKVKDLDSRIGFCIDIGHTFRIGQDPSEMIVKYKNRLYDVHLKDVDKVGPEGANIECGRGVMDLPAVLKTLVEIEYSGVVALEYEIFAKDPLPGASESVGYARGVLDTLITKG